MIFKPSFSGILTGFNNNLVILYTDVELMLWSISTADPSTSVKSGDTELIQLTCRMVLSRLSSRTHPGSMITCSVSKKPIQWVLQGYSTRLLTFIRIPEPCTWQRPNSVGEMGFLTIKKYQYRTEGTGIVEPKTWANNNDWSTFKLPM